MMNKSGIYEILNTVTGKRYVGSAVNVRRRFAEHRKGLRSGNHHSAKLQHSWGKHGELAFKFEILEAVLDKSQLVSREQRWIDAFQSAGNGGYNIASKAGSNLGMKCSDEARARMSAARVGRVVSDITKAKNSASHTGMKRPPRSAEHKAKHQAAMFGRTLSAEHLEKMSAGLRVVWANPEYRQKMSASRKGRRPTDETRKKLSAWQTGRVFSDEHRAKISESKRGKKLSHEHREKIAATRTPEFRARISASLKAYYQQQRVAA